MPSFDIDALLKKMDQIPDQKFPNMIFNPIINTFGDLGKNYWTDFDESNELIDRAMTLGGKFKDFNEYLDAMDVWNEYMELLADKYGSVEIVEVGAKEGTITEFVPRKPQLKKTKKNKEILKSGIIPSRRAFKPTYIGFFDFIKDDIDSSWKDISEDRMFDKVDKETKKMLKHHANKLTIKNRMNMFSTASAKSDAFLMAEEYYQTLNRGGYRHDIKSGEYMSLTQIKKERKRIDNTPEWLLDEELDPNNCKIRMVGNGRFVNQQKEREMMVLQDLMRMGFNPMELATDKVTTKAIKMIMESDDGTLPDSVRQGKMWKKLQKKKKKAMKKAVERATGSASLSRVLNNSIFSTGAEDRFQNWTWDR